MPCVDGSHDNGRCDRGSAHPRRRGRTSALRLMACAKPLRRRPARASSTRSMALSIVTSTSASFGIALVVVSEPTSAMRSTDSCGQPARRTGRREAAAGAARLLRAWDRGIDCGALGLMLLGVGTELRARRQKLAWILLRNHPKPCNYAACPTRTSTRALPTCARFHRS
jgi:hypothetical protein